MSCTFLYKSKIYRRYTNWRLGRILQQHPLAKAIVHPWNEVGTILTLTDEMFLSEGAMSDLGRHYDLLLDCTQQAAVPAMVIAAKVDADFKVARRSTEEDELAEKQTEIYHLLIQLPNGEGYTMLLEQTKHYINLLTK